MAERRTVLLAMLGSRFLLLFFAEISEPPWWLIRVGREWDWTLAALDRIFGKILGHRTVKSKMRVLLALYRLCTMAAKAMVFDNE